MLVLHRDRFRFGSDDVAEVGAAPATGQDGILEPGVPDCRRAHVDATSPLPEIERRPDDGDGSCGSCHSRER